MIPCWRLIVNVPTRFLLNSAFVQVFKNLGGLAFKPKVVKSCDASCLHTIVALAVFSALSMALDAFLPKELINRALL